MKLILAVLIALSPALYELPPAAHTHGVAGAKQAALEVEDYLGRVREAVEDAYVRDDISTEAWEEYNFLDKCATHYHHLFVMSVLFYEEAPVENPYGLLVTKSSIEMIKRLALLKGLLEREGIDIPAPEEEFVARAI